MAQFLEHGRAVYSVLVRVVDDDQDMAFMHVTQLHCSPHRFDDVAAFEHEAVEVLLESFIEELNGILTKAEALAKVGAAGRMSVL